MGAQVVNGLVSDADGLMRPTRSCTIFPGRKTITIAFTFDAALIHTIIHFSRQFCVLLQYQRLPTELRQWGPVMYLRTEDNHIIFGAVDDHLCVYLPAKIGFDE